MADSFDQTIYKLSIDDSGYIRGVDSMSESTKRFVEIQAEANKRLQGNEAALKSSSDFIIKAKKDLDSYTGSNETYRKQLEKTFQSAQADNIKLTSIVAESRKAYEAATKAAQDFASTSQRAANLQPTPGARIPTAVPLGIQSTVISQITDVIKTSDLSGLPEVLVKIRGEFDKLNTSIILASERLKGLTESDPEFAQLTQFIKDGTAAIDAYNNAVLVAGGSTEALQERVSSAGQQLQKLSQTDVSGLPVVIAQSRGQFEQLAAAITLAENRMKGLDSNSEEFKQLANSVAQGKIELQQFDAVVKGTVGHQISLRQEVLNGNNELARLVETGKEASQEYADLEKHVAHLNQLYREQRERVKILSSETRLLDFGKAAVESAVSGFQLYTSVSILAGGASEKLQKDTLQLFAAMQLLTALEQVANTVKRGGVIATNLQSVAQGIYTVAVGASTGALRAFRIALLSTGIGAALVLVGLLVKKYIDYKNAVDEAAANQKLLNDVVKEGNQEAGKQIADLKILTEAAKDTNLSLDERLAAVKALQKEFPDYFGNLSEEAILTGDIKTQTDALTKSIEAASRARAAKGKIDAIESQRLDLDFQRQAVKDKAEAEKAAAKQESGVATTGGGVAGTGGGIVTGATVAQQKAATDLRAKAKLDDIKDKDDALARQEDFLVKFVGLDQLAKVTEPKEKEAKEKTDKKVKEIENEFARKKAELDERLAAATAKEADDESKIRVEFAARLAKEQLAIDELQKQKKVTAPQAEILKAENIQINTVELDKALKDLRKKVLDARQKLNDDLKALQEKNSQDSINLIQDDFDRRAQLIAANEAKELQLAKEATVKRLEALDLQKSLIPLQEYENAKAVITQAGEDQQTNIILKGARDRQALALDIFKQSLDALRASVDSISIGADEATAEKVRELSNKFLNGKITFERFNRDLEKIKRDSNKRLRDEDLANDKDELASLNLRIAETIDKTTKEYDDLLKLRDDFRKKIATKTTSNAQANATDAEDEVQKRVADAVKIQQAIGDIVGSIIGLWEKATQAEADALNRSISIQEKRVEAAQRIAERGNAQYLKTESDKLKQLQVARENAARRELAINAALQGSQVLVAITGAITHLANPVPGAGIAETFAQIAIIVGALATGYALVKSLQGNQPQFKEGTKRVRRDRGEPAGTDTVQAWLNENEAVIPAHRNKAYHPTVEAIYDGKIPAEVINRYVNNYVNNRTENVNNRGITVNNLKETDSYRQFTETYRNYTANQTIKPVPQVNYERIRESATTHIQHDSKLAWLLTEQNRKIEENNDLQRTTIRTLQKMGVNVNMDKNGIAVSVMEAVEQIKKDSRS